MVKLVTNLLQGTILEAANKLQLLMAEWGQELVALPCSPRKSPSNLSVALETILLQRIHHTLLRNVRAVNQAEDAALQQALLRIANESSQVERTSLPSPLLFVSRCSQVSS